MRIGKTWGRQLANTFSNTPAPLPAPPLCKQVTTTCSLLPRCSVPPSCGAACFCSHLDLMVFMNLIGLCYWLGDLPEVATVDSVIACATRATQI